MALPSQIAGSALEGLSMSVVKRIGVLVDWESSAQVCRANAKGLIPEREKSHDSLRLRHPCDQKSLANGDFLCNQMGKANSHSRNFLRYLSAVKNLATNGAARFGALRLILRNCLKHVQSNLVPSRLLPNSCSLNPGRGPKSNRTSRLFRNGQSTVGGPKWTKMGLFRPKWTKMDYLGPFWSCCS